MPEYFKDCPRGYSKRLSWCHLPNRRVPKPCPLLNQCPLSPPETETPRPPGKKISGKKCPADYLTRGLHCRDCSLKNKNGCYFPGTRRFSPPTIYE